MTEIADRYRAHADAFEDKVSAVRPEQWSNPSPCAKWSARDVVDHIVAMHGYMLSPLGRRLGSEVSVAADPLAAFRAARAAVEEVLGDPALAGTRCETPTGPMTVEDQIDQVVSDDLVLHGWDLARATGQDWEVPAAAAEQAGQFLAGFAAQGREMGLFAEPVPVVAHATALDRALGLSGRDPAWRADTV